MTAVTQGKRKKPPTFHYLPKSRAHRLKKSWVEDHKIRSKWRAQKRREGLTNQAGESDQNPSNHAYNETNADAESDTSPNRPDKSPVPTSSHDKQSLRDLRRIAYTSMPLSTREADSSHPKRTPGHSRNNCGGKKDTAGRQTGQPNLKLRMNVLLEKIKRDFS